LQDTGCSPAPEGYAPQIEWQQARVVEFSALRKQISDQMMYLDKKGRKPVSSKALPNIDQEDRWLQLIYGKTPENGDTNSLQMSPFLSIILSLNQIAVPACMRRPKYIQFCSDGGGGGLERGENEGRR